MNIISYVLPVLSYKQRIKQDLYNCGVLLEVFNFDKLEVNDKASTTLKRARQMKLLVTSSIRLSTNCHKIFPLKCMNRL